jgi:DNA-binding response OmpR family regulator
MKRRINKILIVEDNDDHFEIIEFYLKKIKNEVSIQRCADGEEAKKLVNDDQNTSLDIIMLDMNLPKYSGLEVLEDLKKNKRLAIVPVIMFTTSGSDKDVETAYQLGVNSYIQKPDDPTGMEKILRSIFSYWEENETVGTRDN